MANYTWPATSAGTVTLASVGTTGLTAPTSADLAGVIDGSGNLAAIDKSANGIQVDVKASTLPTGAATAAKQDTGNTSVASIDTKTPALVSGRVPVDGSGVTQPVSAASLPLPTGAATAAKQPALGTAGTASTDVITVQGIAAMTALKVDGSGVTQPVSGTVTAQSMPVLAVNATVSSATTVIASQDVSKYQSISVQTNLTGTATITFQCSNDNSNWISCAMANINGSGTVTTVTTSNNIFFVAVAFNYFRVQCTAYTNGNVTAYFVACQHGLSSDVGLRTVTVSNQVSVTPVTNSTATTSTVASSATTVQLLAANSSRKQATFYNDSTAIAYLKLGTTASTTDYTVQLSPNAYYELPYAGYIYSGRIDCIWASATGNMRITELS